MGFKKFKKKVQKESSKRKFKKKVQKESSVQKLQKVPGSLRNEICVNEKWYLLNGVIYCRPRSLLLFHIGFLISVRWNACPTL